MLDFDLRNRKFCHLSVHDPSPSSFTIIQRNKSSWHRNIHWSTGPYKISGLVFWGMAAFGNFNSFHHCWSVRLSLLETILITGFSLKKKILVYLHSLIKLLLFKKILLICVVNTPFFLEQKVSLFNLYSSYSSKELALEFTSFTIFQFLSLLFLFILFLPWLCLDLFYSSFLS